MRDAEFRIRPVDPGDVPRVVNLWLAMMGEHEAFEPDLRLSPDAGPAYHSFLLLNLGNPKSRLLVIESDEEVFGFCVAYITANLPVFLPEVFGYISDIYITPPNRGRGFGTRLLDEVYRWFRRQGILTVHLQVYSGNAEGRRFWKQAGYQPLAVRMWRDLEEE